MTEAHPINWHKHLLECVDFEGSYQELDGYDHFYSETLRGMVRKLQLRIDEARRHFVCAERLHARTADSNENDVYFFFLRLYSTETAILEEVLSDQPGPLGERTDAEVVRFLEVDRPDEAYFDQLRIGLTAHYKLIRGEFDVVLKTFEFLLEECLEWSDQQRIGFSVGAAAAAREVGMSKEAECYYENASFGVNMLDEPLRVALYAGRLYTLLTRWNRHEEAREWMYRIERLTFPLDSKRCMIERAKLLAQASVKRDRIYLS